jgi:hypothetical protein
VTVVGTRLALVELETATGARVELGAFLERSLLVVAIRYYG